MINEARDKNLKMAKRRFAGPASLAIVSIFGVFAALFSSTNRAFAVQRYEAALGEQALTALSKLTISELALLQVSGVVALVGLCWLAYLLWKRKRSL